LDRLRPRARGPRGSNADRPDGYYPKKLGGCIIRDTGGDGSNHGKGTSREGALTIGDSPDSVDDHIQVNLVAAGYGK
jgi:non-reducing end alpha-L-arabinofuranosidase